MGSLRTLILSASIFMLGSCTFEELDLSQLGCPCGTGHTCVAGRCVEGTLDAGPDTGDISPSDLGRDDPVPIDTGSPDIAVDVPAGDSPVDAPEMDGGLSDILVDAPDARCDPAPDPNTVFQFPLNSTDFPVTDATGRHTARVEAPAPRLRTGQCDMAVFWRADGGLVIDDSPAFDLDVGSLDFWAFRLPGETQESAIVSRDASGSLLAGHLAVFWDSASRISVRLQTRTQSVIRCSTSGQPLGEWIHIGVNFGEPNLELWINGVRVDSSGTIDEPPGFRTDCSTGVVIGDGIAGNDNPWLLGGHSGLSEEGAALPITAPYNGALERLRLSSIRRDFSTFRP